MDFKSYKIERWAHPFPVNRAYLLGELVRQGFKAFQWCDQPGAEYSLHSHGEDQTHWIASGQLELTIKDVGVFVLSAGDRDFMPAHTYHSARVLGDEPVIYFVGTRS